MSAMVDPKAASSTPETSRSPSRVAWAFGIVFALMFLGVVGFTAWRAARGRGHEEKVAEARAELVPAQTALEEAIARAPEPYDIDRTMVVLAELDEAAQSSRSVREYVERIARQDYAHVAPQALVFRKRMLDILSQLASQLDAVEDHDKTWSTYRTVLHAMKAANSVLIGVPGVLSTQPSLELRNAASEELQKSLAAREDLVARIRPIEVALVGLVDESAPVVRSLMEEWERLCLVRDAAYLAAARLDYESCARHARAAIERAPLETEAHLLVALAHIEGGAPLPPEFGDLSQYLDDFIHAHPDSAAPALLLRGVWRAKQGRLDEARADLELASTRYPQQSERLRDRFDPYRARAYLRKTSAGRAISGMYEASMLGAGWFSPELELARTLFDSGDDAGAKLQIREHFQRRRQDGQWDLLLYDLDFCENLLGDDFQALFPQVNYLDLEISRPLLGDDVSVSVRNRSDANLRNALLVLCLRFVDMHPDDYVTLGVQPTQPVLPARTTTHFDSFDVAIPWGASTKTIDGLIEPVRAILLTDEAVFRIETVAYKNERIQRFSSSGAPPVTLPERVEQALARVRASTATMRVEYSGVVGQDLRIELPREFALLGPLFRLEFGEGGFDEVDDKGDVRNVVEDNVVALTFDGAGLALKLAKPDEITVVARNLNRTLRIVFARDADGKYAFARIEG